jgi:hypothetical protein
MAIVGGLDIHRRQITYDILDTTTGETRRGQLSPATRLELRAWLARFTGQQADIAFEGTTGWRFVAEELEHAGISVHLAEPADTRALRGPKRRAKTDRTDAHHLRELLHAGTLPEPGCHPPTLLMPVPRSGCAVAWSASAPAGTSASTPSCSTTGCPSAPSCSPPTGGPGSRVPQFGLAHSPRIWGVTCGKARAPTRPACI